MDNFISKDKVKQLIQNAPQGTDPHQIVQHLLDKGFTIEGLNEQPGLLTKAVQGFSDLNTGFLKGAGRTALDIGKAVVSSNPLTMALGQTGNIQKKYDEVTKPVSDALQPSNMAQNIGGLAETAAEFALPGKLAKEAVVGKASTAENALSLTSKELQKVNTKKLKYLSKDVLSSGKTIGGLIKDKSYAMSDKVKSLAGEFSDLLVHKNPEKNLNNVISAGKHYDTMTQQLFNGNESLINRKSLQSTLESAIKGVKDSIYATLSKEQKRALSQSAIDDFMSYVKNGTNKGVYEARKAWAAANRGQSGLLSKVNQVMHSAIQDTIEASLPDAEKVLYQNYKTKMAKLFDVQEILKAKKAATIGAKSLLKKALPYVAGGIGADYLFHKGKEFLSK